MDSTAGVEWLVWAGREKSTIFPQQEQKKGGFSKHPSYHFGELVKIGDNATVGAYSPTLAGL